MMLWTCNLIYSDGRVMFFEPLDLTRIRQCSKDRHNICNKWAGGWKKSAHSAVAYRLTVRFNKQIVLTMSKTNAGVCFYFLSMNLYFKWDRSYC